MSDTFTEWFFRALFTGAAFVALSGVQAVL